MPAGPCRAIGRVSLLMLAQPHIIVEIDHEIFSMVILWLLLVVSESMCKEFCLVLACPGETVWLGHMTIAVDWDVKEHINWTKTETFLC